MFMMALMMDELNYDDTCKFREMYRTQLGSEFAGQIGDFTESMFESHRVWREDRKSVV